MWGVLLEYALSVAWAYVMAFIIVLWALGKFVAMPAELTVDTLLPRWHGMVLTLVCMLQFALSLLIDRRYEPRIGRNYYWMVWYPAAYWLLSLFTTVVALPRTLLGSRNQRATWKTTDRGIR
ncbi:MAG: poly-beta-1,6 N-acetyl-D-glucosamine synthase, partial [Pseudomonadota bacterium]|nr:poly-beta-1,6 N-acetyl-D-glucosamine synthase [Pseudomonadota bacterium]